MKKRKSRITWNKQLYHEVGKELKEKNGRAWKKEAERQRIKKLDCEEGDELRKPEGETRER